ncbi:MAG TPA: VWA domain-containing protein [Bryobacteraceae bacterium]|jgi:VWFA-related protein|nr:VWA domain-containing protein [Bryobacteraceae bacterium]
MALDSAGRLRFTRALLCLLLGVVSVCLGQQKAPPDQANSVIVADTEEVSLDVVVRDKKGRTVKDLKPADLKILDAGSPVAISDLRLITSDADSDHLITLLYDRLNASAGQNAREVTAKLLALQPRMQIAYAVFGINGRMRLLQQYTSDAEAVKLAARIVTGGEKKGDPIGLDVQSEKALIDSAEGRGAASAPGNAAASPADQRLLAKISLVALQSAQQIMQDQHARPALAGLLGLIQAQRNLRGRKVIVYFARGGQSDVNAKDIIRSIAGAANRAGVSIYTVDASAIDRAAMDTLSMNMLTANVGGRSANALNYSQNPSAVTVTAGQRSMVNEQLSRFSPGGLETSPLEWLATETGGQYIAESWSPKKPLQRMFEDLAVYYEASYVPPAHESDGQFRPVSVTPLRSGLVVQSRSGYFALPPATGSAVRPFEAPLLKLLEKADLPSDLRFHADVLHMGELAGGDADALVVEVPMSQIELLPDENTNLFSAHVSIVAQIKDSRGAVIEHFSEDLPRHGALALIEQARAEVITMQRHFTAPPGNYTLETVVMDRNSGQAGGYRLRLQLSKSTGPDISDIVLVRRETPYQAETDSAEPLRYENSQIVPSLSEQLPQPPHAIPLFFIAHPDPKRERPTIDLEVRRNGEPVMRGPLQVTTTAGGPAPYLAKLSGASLEPGDYEIAVILSQGSAVARRSLHLHIDGPQTAASATSSSKPQTTDAAAVATSSPKPQTRDDAVSASAQPEIANQHTSTPLVLSPADASSPAPSPQQASELIEDARTRALSYTNSLPDFMCVELTDRSVDATGTGAWRHRDSMAELLRYYAKQEQRVTLEVDGHRSDVAREAMQGAKTYGEFGGIATSVFRPEAKAEFHWRQNAVLGAGTVQVFAYQVPRATSDFSVVDATGRSAIAGFHGLVYVDEATRAIRRITLDAGDLPAAFAIRSTSFSVDYDYVAINSHEYLMPVSGTLTIHKGKRSILLNQMEFRDYRKYGAETSIHYH